MDTRCLMLSCALVPVLAMGQSADWQSVVWREPQVRYLLADMTLNGGKTELYRKYATEERDPDSRESIRLWDAGARVVNTNEFERKWVTNRFGNDGRVMRIVQRGSNRTITGNEVLLTSDTAYNDAQVRFTLLQLSFGLETEKTLEQRSFNAEAGEALRRWKGRTRVLNTNWFRPFHTDGAKAESGIEFRHNGARAHSTTHGKLVRLNSDLSYPESNVRYFLADMYLGGSRDFYHRTAEAAHEMGCQEAVARYDFGVKINNLDQFERKKVDGKVLITRKGSNERISGTLIELSTDLEP